MADEEPEVIRVPLPDKNKGEMFAIVDKIMGGGHMMVMCADGKSRMARIPGKIKRRMWIREGDLIVIRPWDFQNEKADVVYRYTRNQAAHLSKSRKLPEILDVFGK